MTGFTNSQAVQIGIIGAGPAGLAALKTVLDSPQYKAGQWTPVVFEAREDVGGVWLPSDAPDVPEGATRPIPPTPLYDSLTTNLPHPIMAFSSFPFPPSTPLFPGAAAVRTYLADYSAHFNLVPHIRLKTRVLSVGWDKIADKWAIEVASPSGHERHDFDMVLVCNGHYNVPRYPSVPGLQSWIDARLASHSIFYRNPSVSITIPVLLGSTVLVVGGGPSGQDVTSDLLGIAGKVILSSATTVHVPPNPFKDNARITSVIYKPRTINLDLWDKIATFTDGTTEKIDYCVLATGYDVDFPFFDQGVQTPDQSTLQQKFNLPKSPSSRIDLRSKALINSTWGVSPLVRHIFPFPGFFPSVHNQSSTEGSLPSPTSLAFLGILVRVAPFPLVECQARAALAAFAYPSAMDADARWDAEEKDLQKRKEALADKFQAELLDDDVPSERQRDAFVSREWQRFEDAEQFVYRDALDVLAHTLSLSQPDSEPPAPPHKTKEWERALYSHKGALRAAWRAIEASGAAPRWLDGVGRGESHGPDGELRTPEEEWVDLMWRVLEWGDGKQQSLALHSPVAVREDAVQSLSK